MLEMVHIQHCRKVPNIRHFGFRFGQPGPTRTLSLTPVRNVIIEAEIRVFGAQFFRSWFLSIGLGVDGSVKFLEFSCF